MASLIETTVKLTIVLLCSSFVMPSALLGPEADPHTQADEGPVNEQPATNLARLMSRSDNHTLYEGEDITLPCKIHDIGPFGIVWIRKEHNQDTLLFAGNLRINHDKKYELLSDNSLKISNISKNEAGMYNCTLSTQEPQSVVYHVKIKEGQRKPIPKLGHGKHAEHATSSAHTNCQKLPPLNPLIFASIFIFLLANFPLHSVATGTFLFSNGRLL